MKKVIVILVSCLALVSCKKEDKEPVVMATLNTFALHANSQVEYWAVGGQQVRTISTQKSTINFAWDKDFENNTHVLRSLSTMEGDSLWMSLEVNGKFYQYGRKIRAGEIDKSIRFNYHQLK